MIRIKNLFKSYDEAIFADLSVSFENCGLYVIKGESGSGKSTFLNMLAGFETYDKGVIENDHTQIMIFQSYELIEELTVEKNIYLYRKPRSKDKTLLQKLGLEPLLKHYPKELSGGQKQRAGIARSLLFETEVILCDEPTESLDINNKKVVMDILKELSEDRLVIVVSHDEELIKEYADVVYEIKDHGLNKIYNAQKDFKPLEKKEYRGLDKGNVDKILKDTSRFRTILFIVIFMAFIGFMGGLFKAYDDLFVKDDMYVLNADKAYVKVNDSDVKEYYLDSFDLKEIVPFVSVMVNDQNYRLNIYPLDDIAEAKDVIINQNTADKLNLKVGDQITLMYEYLTKMQGIDCRVIKIVKEETSLNNIYYDLDKMWEYFEGVKTEYTSMAEHLRRHADTLEADVALKDFGSFKKQIEEQDEEVSVYNVLLEEKDSLARESEVYKLVFDIARIVLTAMVLIYAFVFKDRENKRLKRIAALLLSFGITKEVFKRSCLTIKGFEIIALGFLSLAMIGVSYLLFDLRNSDLLWLLMIVVMTLLIDSLMLWRFIKDIKNDEINTILKNG